LANYKLHYLLCNGVSGSFPTSALDLLLSLFLTSLGHCS
jgi:hypothetical protein